MVNNKEVKNNMKITFLLVVILIFTFTMGSCGNTAVENSMVQVWAAEGDSAPIAFGVVVGDGSQIITAFNYEYEIPDELWVGMPGEKKYRATIKAVEAETSATLLGMESFKFEPTGLLAEPNSLNSGEKITVIGWDISSFKKIRKQTTIYNGGVATLSLDAPRIIFPGAIVMNNKGKIAGIIGVFNDSLAPKLGPAAQFGPLIELNSASTLFLPDTNNYWQTMPVYTMITTKESLTGHAPDHPQAGKYNEMTAAVAQLLNSTGEPLPANELPKDFMTLSWSSLDVIDGTLFTAIYPRTVQLTTTSGNVVAEARWVGIQWGRSEGKPNRIFYGHFEDGRAIVDGGFYLLGDISTLESALH
jgi:hypothetical protein